jgi:hypothetical protein
MSENLLSKTPAERLLSLMLLKEKIQDSYLITKKLEEGKTVIHIIHRVEGKRSEEHVSRVVIE